MPSSALDLHLAQAHTAFANVEGLAMSPPQVLQIGSDHVWLAWAPPLFLRRGGTVESYRIFCRPQARANVTDDAAPLTDVRSHRKTQPAGEGYMTRIDGISADTIAHECAVQAMMGGPEGVANSPTSPPTTVFGGGVAAHDAARIELTNVELDLLFARQGRRQARSLFSLEAVRVGSGGPLRQEYRAALSESTSSPEGHAPGVHLTGEHGGGVEGVGAAPTVPPPCAHCVHWPGRPLFDGFSSSVDALPEVSDDDVRNVLAGYIRRQLTRLSRRPIDASRIEAALALHPAGWNARFQIIDGVAYLVGGAPSLINHHHRKRLRGVAQILLALTGAPSASSQRVPNVDFVLNLGDAVRVHPTSDATGAAPPDAPDACADFAWEDLAPSAHGPFGPRSSHDNSLHENGFCSEDSQHRNGGMPPLFSAVACCFSADLSFPTAWYDFDDPPTEAGERTEEADDDAAWGAKRDAAFFRGSIFWFEKHGRTRAFAQSLAHPSDVDVDWYDAIDTAALEADGTPHFGDLAGHAAFKYLLSLEGHSFWSFRLRYLMRLSSAVLHQDLPCHEFWHALLRPYEHYLPLQRNLSDLVQMVRYARRNDGAVRRMASRMRRLAERLLSREAVVGYVAELLTQYAALQADGLAAAPHPRAVPLADVRHLWDAAAGAAAATSGSR